MKKLAILLAFIILTTLLGLPAAAQQEQNELSWQELYWQAYWNFDDMVWYFQPEGTDYIPQINLLDLNNDGALDLIATFQDDGQIRVLMFATIIDGVVQTFSEPMPAYLAYRHKESGELRYFRFAGRDDVHNAGSISEAVFDWDNQIVSRNSIARRDGWPGQFFVSQRRVSTNQHARFYNHFLDDWERVPGLGLGLRGIDIFPSMSVGAFDIEDFFARQGEQYEYVRERVKETFFAALDEIAPDGSLYVEPIPGLFLATEPFETTLPIQWHWLALGGGGFVVITVAVVLLALKKRKSKLTN